MIKSNSRLLTCLAVTAMIFAVQSYFQGRVTLLVACEVVIIFAIAAIFLINAAKRMRFLAYPLAANFFIGAAFLSAYFVGRESILFIFFSICFFASVIVMFAEVVFWRDAPD